MGLHSGISHFTLSWLSTEDRSCLLALCNVAHLAELGLPEAVNQFSSWNKGIILVTGETGSGKSTTLAAILNEINQNRPLHMITLEDPIEYVYEPAQAIINQREVGVLSKQQNAESSTLLRRAHAAIKFPIKVQLCRTFIPLPAPRRRGLVRRAGEITIHVLIR